MAGRALPLSPLAGDLGEATADAQHAVTGLDGKRFANQSTTTKFVALYMTSSCWAARSSNTN